MRLGEEESHASFARTEEEERGEDAAESIAHALARATCASVPTNERGVCGPDTCERAKRAWVNPRTQERKKERKRVTGTWSTKAYYLLLYPLR